MAGPGAANVPGFRHIAFRVTDIDRMAAAIRFAGVPLLSEVRTVPTAQVAFARHRSGWSTSAIRKATCWSYVPMNNDFPFGLVTLIEHKLRGFFKQHSLSNRGFRALPSWGRAVNFGRNQRREHGPLGGRGNCRQKLAIIYDPSVVPRQQ